MPSKHPYPSIEEIIRKIAKALDTAKNDPSLKKNLDDSVKNIHAKHQNIDEYVENLIRAPIEKYIDADFAIFVRDWTYELLDIYSEVIAIESAFIISREQMVELLIQQFFNGFLYEFMWRFCEKYKSLSLMTWLSRERSVVSVLDFLTKNNENWVAYLEHLKLDNTLPDQGAKLVTSPKYNKIYKWQKGESLPSISSITMLEKECTDHQLAKKINWSETRIFLLVARALDHARKGLGKGFIDSVSETIVGENNQIKFRASIEKIVRNNYEALPEGVKSDIYELGQSVKKFSVVSIVPVKAELVRSRILRLREFNAGSPKIKVTESWIDLHEARFFVLMGDLKQAITLYKKVIDDYLYKAGGEQKVVIDEAMVVAASLDKPDRIFLKKLKNALNKNKYVYPSKEAKISDMEINKWKQEFWELFPSSRYGCND